MNHKYNYNWSIKDDYPKEKNGKNVFSCFACGGGSTMGYKLAGFNVLGCNEIDPKMIGMYKTNHNPKYAFNEDIRTFRNRSDLPEELFDIDILDGSPPCSSFSMAGSREDGWGKEKVFREGQKKQTLDDLFFEFIKLANVLKPKLIIAENVKGMISGNSKGYVIKIKEEFEKINYNVQLFLLNAAFMGVPQRRERVFFIAQRNDFSNKKIFLSFNEKPILFGEYRSLNGKKIKESSKYYELLKNRKRTDLNIGDIFKRLGGRVSGFTNKITWDDETPCTLVSSGYAYRGFDGNLMSDSDIIKTGSFPVDYKFLNNNIKYVVGMSVPPVMMANIASEIYKQIFK